MADLLSDKRRSDRQKVLLVGTYLEQRSFEDMRDDVLAGQLGDGHLKPSDCECYKLATLTGTEHNNTLTVFDARLNRENARYWNTLLSTKLSPQYIKKIFASKPRESLKSAKEKRRFLKRASKLALDTQVPESSLHSFTGNVEFIGITFDEPINLSDFVIQSLIFRNCVFKKPVKMQAAFIANHCEIVGCQFLDGLTLRYAQFNMCFSMVDTYVMETRSGDTDWQEITCNGRFTVDNCTFNGLFCCHANLEGQVDFYMNAFLGNNVNLAQNVVGGPFYMMRNFFSNEAWFWSCRFKSIVHISGNFMNGRVSFRDSQFLSQAHIIGNSFVAECDCGHGKFSGGFNMLHSRFFYLPPGFEGAEVNADATWRPLSAWPEIAVFSSDTSFANRRAYRIERKFYAEKLQRHYYRLKILNLEKSDFEDQHFCYRGEMDCKRITGDVGERVLTAAFGVVANFGWSVTRPVLWMAGSVVVGIAWFYNLGAGFGSSVAVSFANQVGFLGFNRYLSENALEEVALCGGGSAIAIQVVIATIMWALLLLGVRNRTKLR